MSLPVSPWPLGAVGTVAYMSPRRPADRDPDSSSLERARRGARRTEDRLHRWETLAERRIREAIEEGALDNLPGKGRPQDLRRDPMVDASTALAHDLLRNAGGSLPWIERTGELRAARAALIGRLERALRGEGLRTPAQVLEASAAEAAELNRRIRDHNLTVPVPGMAVRRLDLDAELARLRVGGL